MSGGILCEEPCYIDRINAAPSCPSKRWVFDGSGFTVIWDECVDGETGRLVQSGKYIHLKSHKKCFDFTRQTHPHLVLLTKAKGERLWFYDTRKKIRSKL